VFGPYTADTPEEVCENIAKADYAARELFALSYDVFCPHKNTAGWEHDSRFGANDFYATDLRWMVLCDLLVPSQPWNDSAGSVREVEEAHRNGLTVYSKLEDVPPAERFVRDCVSTLVDRLLGRRRAGVAEYGVALRPFTTKHATIDVLEEALDLAVYSEQKWREHNQQ
jgi:hypothetical protein